MLLVPRSNGYVPIKLYCAPQGGVNILIGPNLYDRTLKERVIGATVLVLFMVLVVPIFLDGPSHEEEIISAPVTLPGQNDQERRQQRIVLERDRSQPVPASRTSAQSDWVAVSQQKQPSVPDFTPSQSVSEDESMLPILSDSDSESETGMWAVQLGSFSSEGNAERLAADLRIQGYAAFLSQLQTGSGALQRVRIGPQKNRDSAKEVAIQLAKGGHEVHVVPHP